jgi:hypothetical protein
MAGPEAALDELTALLRADDSVISAHAGDPDARPALGELAAAGPRAADAPGEYSLLFEAIREGYLLHYGNPRLVKGADADLALLAGDYLYAIGLERLAALGDLEAVRELSDLISLSAQTHDSGRGAEPDLAAALWLASAVAVAGGATERHQAAKRAVRDGDPGAAGELWRAAAAGADGTSMQPALEAACEAIGFASQDLSHLG